MEETRFLTVIKPSLHEIISHKKAPLFWGAFLSWYNSSIIFSYGIDIQQMRMYYGRRKRGVCNMRHIVPLSGKDSAALAFLLRKLYPDRAFEFTFTPVADREPEELTPWLQAVARLCGGGLILVNTATFDGKLAEYGGLLPSPRMRWCTRVLKIEPMERHLKGDELCTLYLGLRADEDRDGNTGERKGFTYEYPLRDHAIGQREALLLIAEGFGIDASGCEHETDLWRHLIAEGALPKFYEWLSHANCYGCIFWNVTMWRKFYHRMPRKYWEFAKQETVGSNFTYVHGWTLGELASRFNLEDKGYLAGPRYKRKMGMSQLSLNIQLLEKPIIDIDPWEKPCAVCRIGG